MVTSPTVVLAIAVTVAVSGLNYAGVRWGARVNNVTAVLKLLALLAFVVLGPWWGEGEASRLLPGSGPGFADREGSFLGSFGLAMSPILFTYLGWNAGVYVASEVRDPARNLPRSLFLGLAVCAGIYLLMNGVYLYALPIDELRGATDAGQSAADALFGAVGGSLVSAFVLLSVLGTLNATILVGPRIAYAMSLDGLFFRGVDRVSELTQTPSVAIVAQGGVAVALLLVLRNFPSALDFTTFAIVLATMADVAALYLLRRRQPDRPRPYRAWGYPWVPGLYLLANLGIAVAMIAGRPLECAIGAGMLLAGLPFYFVFARSGGGGAGATPASEPPQPPRAE